MKTLKESILDKQDLTGITTDIEKYQRIQKIFEKFLITFDKNIHKNISTDGYFALNSKLNCVYVYINNDDNTDRGVKKIANKLIKFLKPESIENPKIIKSWKSKIHDNRAWVSVGFSTGNKDSDEFEAVIFTEDNTTYIEIPLQFFPTQLFPHNPHN